MTPEERAALPLDEDGRVKFEWDIPDEPAPPAARASTSVWAKLWEKYDGLDISTGDELVGQQFVKAGFSPWARVGLPTTELVKKAQSSLNGYASRDTKSRAQFRPDGHILWLRKVAIDKWEHRFED